jgi:hypothetical protein
VPAGDKQLAELQRLPRLHQCHPRIIDNLASNSRREGHSALRDDARRRARMEAPGAIRMATPKSGAVAQNVPLTINGPKKKH